MLIINELGEFVDNEPPRPYELRRLEPLKDTYHVCAVCGNVFTNKIARARYCSEKCRKTAANEQLKQYRARKAARKAELASVGA